MLIGPKCVEVISQQLRSKVWACLATRFDAQKKIVQKFIKLDHGITQYGKVCRFEGGDLMVGRELVKNAEDSRDASFVQVEFLSVLYIRFLINLSSSIRYMWIDLLTVSEKCLGLWRRPSLAN